MKRWSAFFLTIFLISAIPFIFIRIIHVPNVSNKEGEVVVSLESNKYQYLDGYWEDLSSQGEERDKYGFPTGLGKNTESSYCYRTTLKGMEEGEEYGILLLGTTKHFKAFMNGEELESKFTAQSTICELVLKGDGFRIYGQFTPPLLFKWSTHEGYQNRTMLLIAFFFGGYVCFFLLHHTIRGDLLLAFAYTFIGILFYLKNAVWIFTENYTIPFHINRSQDAVIDILLHSIFILLSILLSKTYLNEFSKSLKSSFLIMGAFIFYLFGFLCENMRMMGLISLECDFVLLASIGFFLIMYNGITSSEEKDVYAYGIEKNLLMDENEQQSIQLMISQIKPHFIYNVFLVIKVLCRSDIDEAESAIVTFSEYLRENINTISTNHPIPLRKEVRHVKNYLYLEKIRFGNRIKVIWNLNDDDIMIPPLTLQVLVENAIRHGIGKKEEGGTVSITTIRGEAHFVIQVEDDGMGFDVENEIDNKRHTKQYSTLLNLRQRIQSILDGEIIYESIEGVGTKVTIRIPFRKKPGES